MGGTKKNKHICPRNCYNSCGIISYVEDGYLQKIEGDISHPFTKGRLCIKGNAYLDMVYSPDRILYPLRQIGRGTGKWERISWEEALNQICQKMLELKARYSSTLPIWFESFSGNLGILHHALRGFFYSIGSVSLTGGQACSCAGMDALLYTFGETPYSDPLGIAKAKLVIIWGGNPAWTSTHQMGNLVRMKATGTKIIVIDPLYTDTASLADNYYQIEPGTDGALALAIAKILIEEKAIDLDFISKHTIGFRAFADYLELIDLSWAAAETGISEDTIKELALLYGEVEISCILIGAGVQRYTNGGQTIRAISTLPILTGNIGRESGGIYYSHSKSNVFPNKLLKLKPPKGETEIKHRYFPVYQLGKEILAAADPPVKMGFIANGNPLSQYPCSEDLKDSLKKMELIVVVDKFMTATARETDLFLPTTTFFEHADLNCSYWHPWIGYNQKAIEPLGETKSDFEIAHLLAENLNRLEPGSSTFPVDKTEEDLLEDELRGLSAANVSLKTNQLKTLRYCKGFREKVAWEEFIFPTPSGKIELFSLEAKQNGLPALPRYIAGRKREAAYPLRLISPHFLTRINSQPIRIPFYDRQETEYFYIGPETAAHFSLRTGDLVRMYNCNGEIKNRIQISPAIPPGTVVCYQGKAISGNKTVNALTAPLGADMGKKSVGFKGVAYYDTFVSIQKVGS